MENKQKQMQLRDIQDVLDVIGGRWKGTILASLCDRGKRFNALKNDLGAITPKVLTKELRYLEQNRLVKRESDVDNTIVYCLTAHGRSLEPVIMTLVEWGQKHRKEVLG